MKRVLIILLLAVPAFADESKCKGNPKVIAACYSVHGRVSLGADTVRLRLWPVGTRRLLGVAAGPTLDDAADPIFPLSLKFSPSNEEIYGDFEVCPFTLKRKDVMQFVCIESASKLFVKHLSSSK